MRLKDLFSDVGLADEGEAEEGGGVFFYDADVAVFLEDEVFGGAGDAADEGLCRLAVGISEEHGGEGAVGHVSVLADEVDGFCGGGVVGARCFADGEDLGGVVGGEGAAQRDVV